MLFTILWIGFLIWLIVYIGQCKLVPWLNKNVFSKIWCEEDKPVVAREAIDRLKELCIDGDVPEETAILMAAQENNISEQDMLNAFNADDAQELIKILSHKKPNMGSFLLKKLATMNRVNMRRG